MTRVWAQENVYPPRRGKRSARSSGQGAREERARAQAWTVFQSPKIERFEIDIIGDLPDGGVAGVDLILGRAVGAMIDAIGGVPAGASGSPVYLGERLIGAVGYTFFPDAKLVGITPIEAMRRLQSEPRANLARRPLGPTGKQAAVTQAYPPGAGGAQPPQPSSRLGLSSRPESRSQALRPAWPDGLLPSAGGFRTHAARQLLKEHINADVFPLPRRGAPRSAAHSAPLTGPAGSKEPPGSAGSRESAIPESGIVPGGPIGIALITGDLLLGAIGTATEVIGERVLGLGHPAFFAGATQIPLTEATILTTAAGNGPVKIGYMGRTVGSVAQDRSAGILGILGLLPQTVELVMAVTDEQRHVTERLMCELSPLPGWLGFLVFVVGIEAFGRAMDRSGAGTSSWEWVVELQGGADPVVERGVSATPFDIAVEVSGEGEALVNRLIEEGMAPRRIRLTAAVSGYRGPVDENESDADRGADNSDDNGREPSGER